MQPLHIAPSAYTPEIDFNPEGGLLSISGHSSPEDVRSLYNPIIDWLRGFHQQITEKEYCFNKEKPLIMKVDLSYFNSSSAKFLFDIINEIKKIRETGNRVVIQWIYDREDTDMKEAGKDIALLVNMDFEYIPKNEVE